jgi:hypothetical protein
MVKGLGNFAAIGTPRVPRFINTPPESLLSLPAADEINLINTTGHKSLSPKQIVRKIKEENRLNYQMNPPANKQQDEGAQFINFAGGYFRGWYIDNGVVTYLPQVFDTESSALEAARNARNA